MFSVRSSFGSYVTLRGSSDSLRRRFCAAVARAVLGRGRGIAGHAAAVAAVLAGADRADGADAAVGGGVDRRVRGRTWDERLRLGRGGGADRTAAPRGAAGRAAPGADRPRPVRTGVAVDGGLPLVVDRA